MQIINENNMLNIQPEIKKYSIKTNYNKDYKQLPIKICWLIEQYLQGNCS